MFIILMLTIFYIENNRWLIKICLNNSYNIIGNINNISYLFGVGVGFIFMFKFKYKFVDFKFIVFNSFVLEILLFSNILYFDNEKVFDILFFCFYWGNFIFYYIDFFFKG